MAERPDAANWSDEQAERWQALAEELRRRLGAGVALEPGQRGGFEGRLGHDLTAAVLHRGSFPAAVAQALGADAVTTGGHVLGGSERLDATTRSGAALLAHELVHVVRQTGAGLLAASGSVPSEPDGEEGAAQRLEGSVRAGDSPTLPNAWQAGAAAEVDAEVVAERVYDRLCDELMLDRERAAWLG